MILALCLALIATATWASPSSFPRTVQDAQGKAFTIERAPRRIVSLAPGTTEMLFALGLGGALVGDTVYCDYPPAARRISKIGDVNVNYEAVLALKPDLIIASDANKSAATRLRALHQPVFAIMPTSFASTEVSLLLLGRVTGMERQARVVAGQMETKRRTAKTIAARDAGRRPRVLVVVGLHPLWTAGSGTFIADIISESGGVNIATAPQYAPLSEETVLADPPDVIMADLSDAAALRADPILRTLQAVRKGRFLSVDQNMLNRPGPRLADALLQVAHALHPSVR